MFSCRCRCCLNFYHYCSGRSWERRCMKKNFKWNKKTEEPIVFAMESLSTEFQKTKTQKTETTQSITKLNRMHLCSLCALHIHTHIFEHWTLFFFVLDFALFIIVCISVDRAHFAWDSNKINNAITHIDHRIWRAAFSPQNKYRHFFSCSSASLFCLICLEENSMEICNDTHPCRRICVFVCARAFIYLNIESIWVMLRIALRGELSQLSTMYLCRNKNSNGSGWFDFVFVLSRFLPFLSRVRSRKMRFSLMLTNISKEKWQH